jgi:hypothetical protein
MAPPTELRSQSIWLDSDGIIHAKLKPGVDIRLADAQEAVRAIASLCESGKRPILVDMTELQSMDRDARVYFAGEETAKAEMAAALLVRSPLTRAIGNFFMGLNKPLFPTRLFTSEEEALTWLKSLPR